jgi:hypothetical protein
MCLRFHDCDRPVAVGERRRKDNDPIQYGAEMGYMLFEGGIILTLITIYVPESMVTTTAWSLAAMGLVLGGYFGWRQITVPYIDLDVILNSWWLMFERHYAGNADYVSKES